MRNIVGRVWNGEPIILGVKGRPYYGPQGSLGVGDAPKLKTTRWKAFQSYVKFFMWKYSDKWQWPS